MIVTTIVEHDLTGLEKVITALEKLTTERFIEGIRCRRRNMYDVEQQMEQVKKYQCRVNQEGRALTKFSVDFIRLFATDNNKCFETAKKLFGKLSSTLAGLKKEFKWSTPRDHSQLPEGVEPPSVFEKSAFCAKEFTPDMLGLESYPSAVGDLYNAIETLFVSATANLALCVQMIEHEAEVREDVVLLRQIFESSCEELRQTIGYVTQYTSDNQELPRSEMEERQKTAKSFDEFLKNEYHRHDKKAMVLFLVNKTLREARRGGLTDLEAFFWGKNPEKGLQVRRVVENFDSIPDIEGQAGKYSSKVIVEFLKWCGVPESQEKKLYKEYFCPKIIASGRLKPLGWSTIWTERKKLEDSGSTNSRLAIRFGNKIIDILPEEETAA
ncbi:MAG: hypothetical protein K6G92_05875 [Bacteroidaceae bacterium]|nr:hypothetical protein [Bacteroidaceae bacterium]